MDKTRKYILDEIKRTTVANDGVPLGSRQFEHETSIRPHEWGRYWARFGDAQKEAGFKPNTKKIAIPDSELLRHLALLARRLGKRPTIGELRVAKREDGSFPGAEAFLRLGSFQEITRRLSEFCSSQAEFADVYKLLPSPNYHIERETDELSNRPPKIRIQGYVYLLKYERYYKIGRTNSVGRRERELSIQLPDKPSRVHEIGTDDPVGIEAYWHKRFADKRRGDSEWFDLSPDDVSAFRWRKFM